jgi:transposase
VNQLIRVGMDTSKSVFELQGVDAGEQPMLRKKLRRQQVLSFFAKLPPTRVGLEACGGSHYWAREIAALGHETVLLPAQYVRPYVKRNKNDSIDADAVCEAMSRPSMRFVPVKSAEQQAGLMLASVREQLIVRRTQLSNMIRGHAAEFGVVAAKGLDKVEPLLARIVADGGIPRLAQELFATLAQEYAELKLRLRKIEAQLMAWHRENAQSRRLAEIPGIGPISASLLVMKAGDPQAFGSGRDFSAWIGLTPRNHSTGGKQRLGGITRAGDEALRRALVVGATAVVQQIRKGRGHASPWLIALVRSKPPKLAAVALANKNARIAWKLLVSGERYDASRVAAAPGRSTALADGSAPRQEGAARSKPCRPAVRQAAHA